MHQFDSPRVWARRDWKRFKESNQRGPRFILVGWSCRGLIWSIATQNPTETNPDFQFRLLLVVENRGRRQLDRLIRAKGLLSRLSVAKNETRKVMPVVASPKKKTQSQVLLLDWIWIQGGPPIIPERISWNMSLQIRDQGCRSIYRLWNYEKWRSEVPDYGYWLSALQFAEKRRGEADNPNSIMPPIFGEEDQRRDNKGCCHKQPNRLQMRVKKDCLCFIEVRGERRRHLPYQMRARYCRLLSSKNKIK